MPRKFTDKQLKENIKKNLLDYMTTHNGCFGQQPDYINGAFRFEEIFNKTKADHPEAVFGNSENMGYPGPPIEVAEVIKPNALPGLKREYLKMLDDFERELDNSFDRIKKENGMDPQKRYKDEEIEEARKFSKDTILRSMNIYKKGYSDVYLKSKLPIAGGFGQFQIVMQCSADESMVESLRMDKNGVTIKGDDGKDKTFKPVSFKEGFTTYCDLMDSYTDYWKDRDEGRLSPVSLVNRRAEILEQMEKMIPLAHKLFQSDSNNPTNLISNIFLGNGAGMSEYEHMDETSERGAYRELYSLAGMHAGLKNGWSLEDLNLLGNFNAAIYEKRVWALWGNEVPQQPGEKAFLDQCEAFMKKVATTPLRNKEDRMAMLTEMEGLCNTAKEKGYFFEKNFNVLDDEMERAKNMTDDLMPVRFSSDLDTALNQFKTSRASIFKEETTEHKNLREAAETVQKLREEYKKALQDKNADKENLEELKNRLISEVNTMKEMADTYISLKKTIPNSPAGKDRLYGAAGLKMAGDMIIRDLNRKEPIEYPEPGKKYKEVVSDAEREKIKQALAEKKKDFNDYYNPRRTRRIEEQNKLLQDYLKAKNKPANPNANANVNPDIKPDKEIKEFISPDALARRKYIEEHADNALWLDEALDVDHEKKCKRIAVAVTLKHFENRPYIMEGITTIYPETFQKRLQNQPEFQEMMKNYTTEQLVTIIDKGNFGKEYVKFSNQYNKLKVAGGDNAEKGNNAEKGINANQKKGHEDLQKGGFGKK